MVMSSTGSAKGLSRIYVDSRAGGANADGSASKPFDTFAEALAIIPDVSDEASFADALKYMRTIVITGNVGDIEIDVPVAIDNTTGMIGDITCTASILLLNGGFVSSIDLTSCDVCRLTALAVNEVTATDSNVGIVNSEVGEITLDGTTGGVLELSNSVVAEEIVVPVNYDAVAMNSVCLGGVDGVMTDYNSGIDMGT